MKTAEVLNAIFFMPLINFIYINGRSIVSPDMSYANLGFISSTSVVTFLRKFGYLPSNKTAQSEAILDHEAVANAIKKMQTFFGLPATGSLDDPETTILLTKGRCGVPDVGPESGVVSQLAKQGLWQKRILTYNFQNWLPGTDRQTVEKEMQKAFDVWSPYSQLTFKKILHTNNIASDISILFARGQHGDRFPFDGPGNILAHAFFPNNNGKSPEDGDIHFDMDEKFVMNPFSKDGWYFLAVATHEIGHSLGLSHSADTESIMFPYYQQTDEPRLSYSDIMNLYEKYIQRNPSEAERDEDKPFATTEKATTSFDSTTEITQPTDADKPPEEETPENYKPNICKDNFDSIAFLRNEIFVFNGKFMWRLREKGRPSTDYPVLISRLFPALKNVERIDAALERDSDGKLLFFSGDKYWIFDGTELANQLPRNIQDFGLPSEVLKIDAAFVWPKNRLTYFFNNDKYWRYNESNGKMDHDYPQSISRWNGISSNLSGIISWKDGNTYFFKDNIFYRFDDLAVQVESGYPMETRKYWFDC